LLGSLSWLGRLPVARETDNRERGVEGNRCKNSIDTGKPTHGQRAGGDEEKKLVGKTLLGVSRNEEVFPSWGGRSVWGAEADEWLRKHFKTRGRALLGKRPNSFNGDLGRTIRLPQKLQGLGGGNSSASYFLVEGQILLRLFQDRGEVPFNLPILEVQLKGRRMRIRCPAKRGVKSPLSAGLGQVPLPIPNREGCLGTKEGGGQMPSSD